VEIESHKVLRTLQRDCFNANSIMMSITVELLENTANINFVEGEIARTKAVIAVTLSQRLLVCFKRHENEAKGSIHITRLRQSEGQ